MSLAHHHQPKGLEVIRIHTRTLAAIVVAATVAAVLAMASAAGAATVSNLNGPFTASNPSVALGADGVTFGPYADGGASGGSLATTVGNGLTVAQIVQLSYTFRYNTQDDRPIGAPYLRIFLNDDADDIVLDPTHCAVDGPPENETVTLEITQDTSRYNDDPCNAGFQQLTWDEQVAAHGDDIVSGIYVTQGFSGGQYASALLTSIALNGTTYTFTGRGDIGPIGFTGEPGRAGVNGGPGPKGQDAPPAVCTSTRTVRLRSVKGASSALILYTDASGNQKTKRMTFRAKSGHLVGKVSLTGRRAFIGATTRMSVRSVKNGKASIVGRRVGICG